MKENLIETVRNAMPEEELLMDVADLFKTFADSTRVRILSALSQHELCVCDLAEVVGMTKSAVSHQLRLLRMSKLVKQRRSGKEIIYSLDDEHVHALYAIAIAHICENKE